MHVKRSYSAGYVTALALAAALILVGGWLARPRDQVHAPAPIPSEADLAQLARRAERRAIDDMNQFFARVAEDAAAAIVAITNPPVSAINWESRQVLAPARARASGAAYAAAVLDPATRIDVSGPALPFALVEWTVDGERSVARPTSRPSAAGDWVVAVWRTSQGPVWDPGHFRQRRPIPCGDIRLDELVTSLVLGPEMLGGGLFDLENALVGPILQCGDRLAAVSVDSVRAALDRERAPDRRAQNKLGLTLAQTTPAMLSGTIASSIWPRFCGVPLEANPVTGACSVLPN